MSDLVKNDPICAACSRFHKHLCGDYSEEFSRSMWEHIDSNLQLLQGMENTLSDEAVRSRRLQDLYGKHVLPDSLLDLCNNSLGRLECRCPHGTDRDAVARAMRREFCRLIILVDEKLVSSRFFDIYFLRLCAAPHTFAGAS